MVERPSFSGVSTSVLALLDVAQKVIATFDQIQVPWPNDSRIYGGDDVIATAALATLLDSIMAQ